MSTKRCASNDAGRNTTACRRCGRVLHPGRGDLYVISILALADPAPPVFTEDDLAQDIGAEILRLSAQLNRLDAEEAQDQVYRRVVFHLCSSCYRRWVADPTGASSGTLDVGDKSIEI
jgi:hypothetical protein